MKNIKENLKETCTKRVNYEHDEHKIKEIVANHGKGKWEAKIKRNI